MNNNHNEGDAVDPVDPVDPVEPVEPLTAAELARADEPTEAWMAELTRDALPELTVPREAMWTNIQRLRSDNVLPFNAPRRASRASAFKRYAPLILGMAATLVVGVAIGRYGKSSPIVAPTVAASRASATIDTSALPLSSAPTQLAMAEHLARTEALLTSVKNDNPATSAAQDVAGIARDLLGTTRLLLDDPTLNDVRTRRLLQDLELVLVQLVQSRAQNPAEARRVPRETLQETNLLPRLRAAKSTAQLPFSEFPNRGITE